jgi:predicted RNase H-like HicB family nuclease
MVRMYTYTIANQAEEPGRYPALVPAFPGCFTRGSTAEGRERRAVEGIGARIAGLRSEGLTEPRQTGQSKMVTVTVAA